jgi:hypothetical protein
MRQVLDKVATEVPDGYHAAWPLGRGGQARARQRRWPAPVLGDDQERAPAFAQVEPLPDATHPPPAGPAYVLSSPDDPSLLTLTTRRGRWAIALDQQYGEAVVHQREPEPIVLVCMECLLTNAPPASERHHEPHPFVHPEHCGDCATFNPHPRQFDPLPWTGIL